MSRVATNSVWQLVSFAARAISGLGVVVLLARSGGPDTLGLFQFALVLTALLPYYFGLPSLLAREVARRPDQARSWLEAGTLIAIVFGCVFSALFFAGSTIIGAEAVAAISLASVGMAFDGIARVQFSAFWAWERLQLEAFVTVAQESALLIGVAAVAGSGGGVTAAMLAFVGSRALGATVGFVLVSRILGGITIPRGRPGFIRQVAVSCVPFAANDTLTLTYMRADTVLLGLFKGNAAVGLYQAGTNLVLNLNVLARSINRALYPRMSRAWPGQMEAFRRICDTSFRSISLIALPITVGSFLLAGRTFEFLYGSEFSAAVVTYQLLVLIIPVRMLGHTLSLSLAATDRQNQRMLAVSGAAAFNLALNLVLIPMWSYLGAAIATVVSEFGLLIAYAAILHPIVGPGPLLRSLSLPALATIPMGGLILVMGDLGLIATVLAGALVYGMAVAVLALMRSPRSLPRHPRAVISRLVGSPL